MTALFSAIRKAGAALSAQLALTFFVPLCLTGLAIVARIQVGLYPSFLVADALDQTSPPSTALTEHSFCRTYSAAVHTVCLRWEYMMNAVKARIQHVNRGWSVQVLAAQWVHDAVIAYNALIEHVCILPQQIPHPGMFCQLLQLCLWNTSAIS